MTGDFRVEVCAAPFANFIAAAADAGDVGADGLAEAIGEGRVSAAGLPAFGQVPAVRGDLREVAAGFGREGLGLGDGLAGILGVQLAGAGRADGAGPGRLGRGDEAWRP